MANARALLSRRKGAQNTRKITRTMELVSAAKLRKAQQAADAARPYAEGLSAMVGRLAAAGGGISHPLLEQRPAKRVVLLVCSSDRGLCGAFNANIIKVVSERVKQLRKTGAAVEVHCLGKKGAGSLRWLGITVDSVRTGLISAPRFAKAVEIIAPLIKRFLAGEIDLVECVYSRFESVAKQTGSLTRILPAGAPSRADGTAAADGPEFLYSPAPAELLAGLIPQTVRSALFACMLQTGAGEHAARRMAMKNATDNAGDLIRALSSRYNRARQGKITQEISEIVGAVEAMT